MRLCQDPRFCSGGGLPAWPPRDTAGSSSGRSTAWSTATICAPEATLGDVRIVRPYMISRHLILTVRDHDNSWKVPLRLDQPVHIPALHEFLVANLGRTIAEIGDLETEDGGSALRHLPTSLAPVDRRGVRPVAGTPAIRAHG